MPARRGYGLATALAFTLTGSLLASCSSDTRTRSAPSQATATSSQALNLSPTIGNFALYAERSVNLGSQDQIRGGDIGVATVTVASFGTQLIVGEQVQVSRTNNLLAPSVSLGAQSQVGDVQTTTLTNNGAQSLGTVAAYSASLMPPLPLAGNPTGSTSNVTVAPQAHESLSPGAYGNLTIGNQAQVTLAAGSYSFSSVSIGNQVHIVGNSAGVTLLVSGTFAAGSEDQINRSGGGTANQLTILIGANDGGGGTPPAASIGQQTQMTALLAAPHGTLAVAPQAQLTGAFAAFDISLSNQVQVSYQSGLPTVSNAGQQGQQQLSGYITPAMAAAPLLGPVPGDTMMQVAIGLPLRDVSALQAQIVELYDPSSPMFHQYLSPGTFAGMYGPLPGTTGPLLDFITASGLTLVRGYTSNQLFDVAGTAAQLESAFFVSLNYYQRPDGSVFYAPDREPSLNLSVATTPIARIDGLDSFLLAAPLAGSGPVPTPGVNVKYYTGTNLYMGSDFRNAYLPGVALYGLYGLNQSVAIVALDSFMASDVGAYETCRANPQATPDCNPLPSNWSPTITPTVIPIDFPNNNAFPTPPPAPQSMETILDIDMVVAMAPGLANIYVYEAPAVPPSLGAPIVPSTMEVGDILAAIANPTSEQLSNQISCSWSFWGSFNTAASLYQFALQGQSFFLASGDSGSYADSGSEAPLPIADPQSNYMTIVGGTRLTTDGNGAWQSEVTWNDVYMPPMPPERGAGHASGGGSLVANNTFNEFAVPLPPYQAALASGNPSQIGLAGGNATVRAVPDVAMVATDIGIYFGGKLYFVSGTSAAAPLWAGFTALVNESAPQGRGALGFANPSLYTAGQANFNDITAGTNSEVGNSEYTATTGFDLATGWGTPTLNLIGTLACPNSCGVTCVNLASDPNNCGSCGTSCGVGGFCVGGTCGAVTVGLMATTFEGTPGMEFCIVGVGFDPGDFITVTFSGAPEPGPSRTGVVDGNGQWAYWNLVPFTTCTPQQAAGQFALMEQSSNQPTSLMQSLPADYFCGLGPAPYGPPFTDDTTCIAPDGTGGLFFGE